jgi:CPA2 family monovalent cation:H+ antiporter-2
MPQTIESLGNMGILLFLFEIGMGLNFDRFVCLRHDIFGLGIWQLALTSWAGYLVCQLMGLTSRSSLAVALAMAMSSTAFVLQILTNKNEMNSPIGRASFGMLLLQDVAILPILLLFDFMTKGGSVATQLVGNLQNLLAAAVGLAVIYGTSTIVFGPMFPLLNRSDLDTKVPTSLALVLIASLWTQLCGLSESLGAFLGGIFLSGTRYEHDIAQALAPMRTLLMGLFFLHVGFDIDMFVICETPRVFALLLVGLYLIKSSIIAALSHLGGLGIKDSIRCGLLNGQAGEFALVVLEAAHRLGIIDGPTRRFCLTLAAVSMAGTPLIDSLASRVLGVQSDLSAPSGPGLQVSSEIGARIKARVTRLTHTDHGM